MIPLHVVYLGYSYEDTAGDASALLKKFEIIPLWCGALKRAGVEQVTAVQRFNRPERFVSNGIAYAFCTDEFPSRLEPWHVPRAIHALVASLNPDVVHVNGSVFPIPTLRKSLGQTAALLWQHHAGFPKGVVRRIAYRAATKELDGFLFTSSEIGAEWRRAGVIRPEQRIFEVIEASSSIVPLPIEEARETVAMTGTPSFLWVGRLNPNKDPITVLRGFAAVVAELQDPRLYMVYHESDLLPEVLRWIKKLHLESRVCLIGKVEHSRLAVYYSAADYFVLGSHHESTGFALLEALSCGAVPIVTNIPAFRRTTNRGAVGELWEPGRPSSCSDAIRRATQRRVRRFEIRTFFERNWSYDVLGRVAADAYQEAVNWRRSRQTRELLP